MSNLFEIFQVWPDDGTDPSETTLKKMMSIISNRREDCGYTLISAAKNIDFEGLKIKSVDVHDVEKGLFEVLPKLKNHWSDLNPKFKSEFLRFYWASNNSNAFYFDTDVHMKRWVNIFKRKGKPYLVSKNGRGTIVDHHAFFVNGQKVWFRDLLKICGGRIVMEMEAGRKMKYSTFFSRLNSFAKHKGFYPFNPTFFTHHRVARES